MTYKQLEGMYANRRKGSDYKVLNTAKDKLKKENGDFVFYRKDDVKIATVSPKNILTVECDPEKDAMSLAVNRAVGRWAVVRKKSTRRLNKYPVRIEFKETYQNKWVEFPIHQGATVNLISREVTHGEDSVLKVNKDFNKEANAYIAKVAPIMDVLWRINKDEIKQLKYKAKHSMSELENFELTEENLGLFAESALAEGYVRCVKPYGHTYLAPGQSGPGGITNKTRIGNYFAIPEEELDKERHKSAVRLGKRRLKEILVKKHGAREPVPVKGAK